MPLFEKPKILVIDDEEEMRLLLEKMLGRKGYCVYCAADGRQGLEMAKRLEVKIILCDIVMPRLSGTELLKELRKQNLAIQVIMVTGKSDSDSCKEAFNYGVCGYLLKPFSAEELFNSITLAEHTLLEKKQMVKETLSQIKSGKANYILKNISKKSLWAIGLSLFFYSLLTPLVPSLKLSRALNWAIFDRLQRIESVLRPAPQAINDILLVVIDNKTLKRISQRWPYSRSVLATVINNLRVCQPRVIAFDFTFMGKSSPEDDQALKDALLGETTVVLGSSIDEKGRINFLTIPELKGNSVSGFVNVLSDDDGVSRRGLIYLKEESKPFSGFLSWDMEILRIAKRINLDTFSDRKNIISFQSFSAEKWVIPADPETKSFYINFRADAPRFKGLSFYRVLEGDFNPEDVRDKIVLVGISSPLLGDFHNTPIGVIPGIILKANTFLTLYVHDFLREIPKGIGLVLVFLGILFTVFAVFFLKNWQVFILIASQIVIFFLASYLLLLFGYVWDYATFLQCIITIYLFLLAGRRLLSALALR